MISVILGSHSDYSKFKNYLYLMDKYFEDDWELNILSAHRMPKDLEEHVVNSNAKVFICIAGMAAALPGVVASHTLRPVIGVPLSVSMMGLDSLLSMAQMPSGIPVATVAVDGIENGITLAAQMLAVNNADIEGTLRIIRTDRREGIRLGNPVSCK